MYLYLQIKWFFVLKTTSKKYLRIDKLIYFSKVVGYKIKWPFFYQLQQTEKEIEEQPHSQYLQ